MFRKFIIFAAAYSFCRVAAAAVLSDLSQDVSMNFGVIDALSGGNVDSSCFSSGANSLGGCFDGSFTVTGEDSLGDNSRKFKVFIDSPNFNISQGGGNIAVAISLDPSSSVLSKIFELPVGGGIKYKTFSIYGNSTILNSASQVPGSYSGNYDITVCSCDEFGCPSDSGDSLCL